MIERTTVLILATSAALTFGSACTQRGHEIMVVDEPSVRLDAELNLHYKTFSEVKLTDEYLERWLYKYNYLPGAEVMFDEELFAAIDLDRDGLELVKAAAEQGNYKEAQIALADYFRGRSRPCYIDAGVLSPSGKEKTVQVADECLLHPNFPDVRWSREKLGHGCKDAQWNWVSHLCRAYRYTGEMNYLQGLTEIFLFWYETVRPPAGAPRIWLSPSFIDNPWCSHQASRRLNTLAQIDGLLQDVEYDEIPPAMRLSFYKSVVEHARFLIAVNPGYRSGNIQICQMLYLLEAGVYFPEFSESRDWIDFAWKNLIKHAWLDILPDGGHYERATGYNNVVVRDFRRALEIADLVGLQTPDWLRPKLKSAQEWTVKVYSPLLNLTPVGDSGMGAEGYALPHLIDGALLFPCPESKYFVSDYPNQVRDRAVELFGDMATDVLLTYDGIAAKPPCYTSVLLPDTEWAVMRSGWDREARYMLFDYGSNEPWHCHRDGLGFSIFAFGQPLIIDSGHTGGYQVDRSKTWYKETIAHNVVMINGMSQRKVTGGTCHRWVSAASCDYIDAEHDGYKYLGAHCRRKITFVKPSYWIVSDNITEKMCQTSGYHECEWLAHFQPTELALDERRKRACTSNPDANVVVIPARPETLRMRCSTGWMVTPAGEADDAPYISYAREGDLPIDYEVIIYPYESTEAPQVQIEQLDMREDGWRCKGLMISSPKGVDYYLEALKGDYYFVMDEKTSFRQYGEFAFDGEMALLREEDGQVSSILLVGGSCLRRAGLPLARCTGNIEWAEILFSDGTASVDGDFGGKMIVTLPEGRRFEAQNR
ncbi:MAG: alginate lyase family protein [Phycisphaerales bacterium]|nr:alginate lyase family protein [Phycisphaerales bacterium]